MQRNRELRRTNREFKASKRVLVRSSHQAFLLKDQSNPRESAILDRRLLDKAPIRNPGDMHHGINRWGDAERRVLGPARRKRPPRRRHDGRHDPPHVPVFRCGKPVSLGTLFLHCLIRVGNVRKLIACDHRTGIGAHQDDEDPNDSGHGCLFCFFERGYPGLVSSHSAKVVFRAFRGLVNS